LEIASREFGGASPHSIKIVLSGSRKSGIEDLNLELRKSGREGKDLVHV
jgi:hypothetical protein